MEELEHTENAGDKAITRLEDLMAQLTDTVGTMGKHVLALTDHVASLEVVKAAEQVPEGARETVDKGVDAAGTAGDVAVKSVDVPLAVSEDVIHDSGKAVSETNATVQKARKKLFRKRGR